MVAVSKNKNNGNIMNSVLINKVATQEEFGWN
jgi:hypothetical protein